MSAPATQMWRCARCGSKPALPAPVTPDEVVCTACLTTLPRAIRNAKRRQAYARRKAAMAS